MARYSYSIDVRAGCFECWGSDAHWTSKNAHGLAAQHNARTGHETWVDSAMSIRYTKKVIEVSDTSSEKEQT
jgi:hypothetical protein